LSGAGAPPVAVVLGPHEHDQDQRGTGDRHHVPQPQRRVSPATQGFVQATTNRSEMLLLSSYALVLSSRGPRRRRRVQAVLLVAFVGGLLAPAGAHAHAFLISSSPLQGARLASTPRDVVLSFSEPVVPGSEQVSVRRPGGGPVSSSHAVLHGALVREALPRQLSGVFIVSWRVLADDGHLTEGEFAFAAGSAASLPSVSAGNASRTPPEQEVLSALVFIGLALALGGLVSERLVFTGQLTGSRRPPVATGLTLALLGALAQLVLVAGQRAGGGFGSGVDLARVAGATGTRPGMLTAVLIVSLLLAGVTVRVRRYRWLGVVPLAVAVLTISLRSHAGTSGRAWAVGADAVHLGAVALWVGLLAHLVLSIRSTASEPGNRALAAAVRRYSALALPTVLVILAAGALDALAELRAPSDLVNTGYGRTLLIKGGVVALALSLALASRLLTLRGYSNFRFGLLRRLTLTEAIALVGVLLVAAILVNAAPPRSSAQAAIPAVVLGPPPVQGPALQLATLAGLGTVVGVTAAPDELRFRILRVEDPAPTDTRVTVHVTGTGRAADLSPRPCGPGCFAIRYRLRSGITRLVTRVAIPNWPSGSAEFDVPWPPQPAQPALLARIVRAMRAVRRMVLVEHVSSGPRAFASPTVYRGDGQTFIAGEPWTGGSVDVRPLDRPPYRRLAFSLPGSDIWVRITVDDRDRLLSEALVTPGHLIRRTFTYP